MNTQEPKKRPVSPISEAGVLNNRTGSWRYLRPSYEEKRAPCIAACPAGERVEEWIRLLEQERYAKAWRLIKTTNPLPRVCGRVCFHPCEADCNRGHYDRPVAIHSLERFVSDHARSIDTLERPRVEKSGKRIGVVGSGPAGLACAYHLALRGHDAVVYEAETELGGLLRHGIPAYRLPKDVLNEEIEDILALGIDVRTGVRVEDFEELRATHDAVFVATGLGVSKRLGIPGEAGEGVMSALDFLNRVNSGAAPELRGKVVIVGGGNAAIDAARAAVRLGEAPTILYRRSREEMPAYPPEVEEAEREGVAIHFLAEPVEIIRENGRPILLECVRNQLGEIDKDGRKKPIAIKGSNFFVEASAVIVAIGEGPETTFSELYQSKSSNVFFGGDLIVPQRTVAHAIGSGRRAAMEIDRCLGGCGQDPAGVMEGPVVRFEDINIDYFVRTPRARVPMLSLGERQGNFSEVCLGLEPSAALEEAGRCFHCGACISCDNCFDLCPDIAVRKTTDGRYLIDYDYCKGCGICVHECPRNAMSIAEEDK
ncbi:MAG: NAD(P)-binding protein [Candidatus Abyssubacteria bacterium]